MFTLPSIWNVLISTVVFVVAAWYARRFLEEQGIPKGIARGLAVFMLAYLCLLGIGRGSGFYSRKNRRPASGDQTGFRHAA